METIDCNLDIKFNNLMSNPPLSANERALRQLEYDKVEEMLQPYVVDMTKELPTPRPIISIGGSCVCSRGNISAICGESKSKKTFLTSALVASAMAEPLSSLNNFATVAKNSMLNVLWVDTEQSELHVRRVVERISKMTGATLAGVDSEPRLTTMKLRELSAVERKRMVVEAIHHFPYDLIVIDGIADLQRNPNDLEESEALIAEFMGISTYTNTHIICVLHTNPGSDKARGHLGSALQRKAETVLYVHRAGDISIVEPQFCRNEPFARFAFEVNEEGIPELCDLPTETPNENPLVALVRDTYGGVIERKVLRNKLMDDGLGRGAALMRISRAVNSGHLVEKDGYLSIPECHGVTVSQGRDTRDKSDTTVTPATSATPIIARREEPRHERLEEEVTECRLFDISARQSMAAYDDDCPF